MARSLWLPDVLRRAGLTVREVGGWRTRGSESFNPRGVVVHATAGSRTATDAAEIGVLLRGSTSAPPPIAQLYLSRTGTWHVVASGRCNHVVAGFDGTPFAGYGNSSLIGVEAANDNRGEAWPPAQYDSYVRGVAAICRHMRWPASRVVGHKEHQPRRKTDPTFNMSTFRRDVDQALAGASIGDDLDMGAVERILGEMYRLYLLLRYGVQNPADASDPSKRQAPCLQSVHERQVEQGAAIAALAEKVGLSAEDLAAITSAARDGARLGVSDEANEAVAAALRAGADAVEQG